MVNAKKSPRKTHQRVVTPSDPQRKCGKNSRENTQTSAPRMTGRRSHWTERGDDNIFFYVWPLWCACSFSGCKWVILVTENTKDDFLGRKDQGNPTRNTMEWKIRHINQNFQRIFRGFSQDVFFFFRSLGTIPISGQALSERNGVFSEQLSETSGVFSEQLSEFKNDARNENSHSRNGVSRLEQCESHSSRSNSRSDSLNRWEPACKIFICPCILGAFLDELGRSPRARSSQHSSPTPSALSDGLGNSVPIV